MKPSNHNTETNRLGDPYIKIDAGTQLDTMIYPG